MALVGYDSSDDEDEQHSQPESSPAVKKTESTNNNISKLQSGPSEPLPEETIPGQDAAPAGPAPQPSSSSSHPAPPAELDAEAAPIGPQLGPSAGPGAPGQAVVGPSFPPLEGVEYSNAAPSPQPQQQLAPGSPYTAHRTTLRDLTLPTVPNMDIPPSPAPLSPSSSAQHEAHLKTSAKFDQFLTLKKQGIHFNSKITSSAALRNPSLTDKLMGFVDIDHKAQYANTLPQEIWNPAAFPRWSYKEQLRQSQADTAAGRIRGQGAPVAFVPAVAVQETPWSDSQGKRRTRFDA
ncbi:HCNGP-like protein-domain-containing protein [Microdochium bolleyi]|uniref:HCNGP-like protein-domain-containing protein n=1 Tax=Microdochium bolleyi TaxID=196109 RepID=A0A136JFP0_9PEZI|nr:HCNGP-like protein-domain-containing protein [Microdochium bolleyi]